MADADITKALLEKGYFPKELPPAFTTSDFGIHSIEILKEWTQSSIIKTQTKIKKTPCGNKRHGAYNYQIKSTEAETISKPKRGYERRNVHITHPVPQALLAQEIGRNWKSIQKWLSRQKYSEDDIRVSAKYTRSIKGINFPLHRVKKAYLESTSDWLVKTDISRFYPSIYTHSIPWAAYGKERVKKNLGYYTGSLADRLDMLVRACNRNQTIGIPVGPETSRIIAEIISSRIDTEFHQEWPDHAKNSIDRLQDDWIIGVETLEKAERSLSTISKLYRAFELEINGSKTSIEHIVSAHDTTWISEIGAFLSHSSGAMRGARLREFVGICLRLQTQHTSEPVINYALSVIENSPTAKSDAETMESFLLKAAVVAPISMDRICRIILDLQHHTKNVSAKRIGERFIPLVERNFETGHTYEVIWLLYTLRGLKRPFKAKTICEMAESSHSAAIPLLLLDMKNKGMGLGTLPKATWEAKIREDTIISDWTWLLGYEGFRHGWLSDKDGLMAKPFLKPMADRNVVFYDPRRNVPTSRSFVKMRKNIRKRDQSEIRLLLQAMRGFDFSEY